ncbi:MAG: dienelactone hydrolase family protein [Microbacteriaceae bacterium]|jgi:carboxymethylenebutenolidase|nr:dienelactone hydrolase family protein [Microbacteriaceae bacterium]
MTPLITLPVAAEPGSGRPDEFPAYIARPDGDPKGGLIVIHEIWGLVDHIMAVADRFAAEGYLVVAPDLLSSVGIEAQVGAELSAIMRSPDERVRTEGQPRLRDAFAPIQAPEYGTWAVTALRSSVDFLAAQTGIDGRIGVVGFCFGGSYSFALAVADPRVRAAVPFYGAPPDLADVAKVTAPILAIYGEDDQRLMDSLPEVTAAMQAAGVRFSRQIYEGAGHAFFNDANPHAYRPDAAADAWRRTLEFLGAELA